MKPARKRGNPTRKDDIDRLLERVEALPTLPILAIRVGEMVHDPDVSAREIADVMRSDPSISAKVLKLVNSPYYGIPGGITDVQRAISFLGFNTLHQLVLSVSVFDALRTPAGARFDAGGMWLHSLAVGSCAQVIAEDIGFDEAGSCFTAGLLHDVGKIALAKTSPAEFCAALDTARHEGISMAAAEQQVGLPSHDSVGDKLGRLWKFPAGLLAPIALHHAAVGGRRRSTLSHSLRTRVDIVSVSDELCRHFAIGESGSPAPESVDVAGLERLGFSTNSLDRLYSQLMRQLEVSRVFLELMDL